MKIVLGSTSPRRAELLPQLGVSFCVRPGEIDETPVPGENPLDYVTRMAREKSHAVPLAPGELLLTADTSVFMGNEILGKPVVRNHAVPMLRRLSGRSHEVLTAVFLRTARSSESRTATQSGLYEFHVRTTVEFSVLDPTLIEAYLDTEEPWDKAGAYALQGFAGSFVRGISGSVSNVIGLPQVELREALRGFGVPLSVGTGAVGSRTAPAG